MIEDIETIFPQVLLMGNGINLAYGGVSWNNLLSDISKRKDLDFNKLKCPMPLKAVLVTNNHIREALMSYKDRLYGEVKTEQQLYALQRLLEMEFDHIITTNYSYELDIADPADEIVALAVVITIDCVTESNSGASVTVSNN